MPWMDQGVVNQRMHFVTRLEAGERMAELCREFGISRKTGYKILERYKDHGPEGLFDQSRRPHRISRRTSPEIVATIVALRKQHPTWGARKLRAWLERHEPALNLPTRSPFGDILRRNGLIEPRRLKQQTPRYASRLRTATKPNDVWCIDFKVQFRTGDSKLCYPLTISDQYSRFLLGVEGLEDTKTFGARAVMERIFSEYGLPEVIRSDNGTPFSSRSIAGLSRLFRVIHKGLRFFLGQVLAGYPVGLRELDDGRWLVSFAHLHLGVFHPQSNHFEHLRSDPQPILEELD